MAGFDVHERIFRGAAALEKLARPLVVICGAGAVGSNLAETLARQGFRRLRVIDKDRVEERNLGTQVFTRDDVGALKAEALRNHVFRAVAVELDAVAKQLTPNNGARLLKGADLILDGFDNRSAREIVTQHALESGVPCLHIGFNGPFAEVRWNEHYRVPSGTGEDVCDYPLARNVVALAVAVAAETVVRFVLNGEKADYSLTLGDFAIHRDE